MHQAGKVSRDAEEIIIIVCMVHRWQNSASRRLVGRVSLPNMIIAVDEASSPIPIKRLKNLDAIPRNAIGYFRGTQKRRWKSGVRSGNGRVANEGPVLCIIHQHLGAEISVIGWGQGGLVPSNPAVSYRDELPLQPLINGDFIETTRSIGESSCCFKLPLKHKPV